jgi:hypothetical protein
MSTITATIRQHRWGYKVSTDAMQDSFDVIPVPDTIPVHQCKMTLAQAVLAMHTECKSIGPCWKSTGIYLDGRRIVAAEALGVLNDIGYWRDILRLSKTYNDIQRVKQEIANLLEPREWELAETQHNY